LIRGLNLCQSEIIGQNLYGEFQMMDLTKEEIGLISGGYDAARGGVATAGATVGGIAGAEKGALIGAPFGPIGAVAGVAAGALVGGTAGYFASTYVYDSAVASGN